MEERRISERFKMPKFFSCVSMNSHLIWHIWKRCLLRNRKRGGHKQSSQLPHRRLLRTNVLLTSVCYMIPKNSRVVGLNEDLATRHKISVRIHVKLKRLQRGKRVSKISLRARPRTSIQLLPCLSKLTPEVVIMNCISLTGPVLG